MRDAFYLAVLIVLLMLGFGQPIKWNFDGKSHEFRLEK